MQSYMQLLKTMIQDFERMIVTENQKIQAIREGDLGRIDICMREEQAHILQLRGFEKKRIAIQEEMGLKDLTLREITQQAPEAYRQEMSDLSAQLQDSVKRFKAVNESANEMLRADLRFIERLSENSHQANSAAESAADIYTKAQDKANSAFPKTHFTNRKV